VAALELDRNALFGVVELLLANAAADDLLVLLQNVRERLLQFFLFKLQLFVCCF
jgi:hypothetical protein